MNYFGFMDETGVLANDPSQPYFALGLLKLNDTSELLQTITTIKAKYQGILSAKSETKPFYPKELKFNSLSSKKFVPLYQEIINACLAYKGFYFSVILVEKAKMKDKRLTTWDLQLQLAKNHIQSNCKSNDKIAIIADYLNKPKGAVSFETKMKELPSVFNACMLESDTSIFIQIVDLFIGAVIYRYKHPLTDSKRANKAPKMQLVTHIENVLLDKFKNNGLQCRGNYKQHKSLQGNFTLYCEQKESGFYFSVYEKKN